MAKSVILLVLVVLTTTSFTTPEAQPTQDCASKLTPCYTYLTSNSTPTANCCNPIKETVTTELPCLCTLYYKSGVLANLNITVEQALRIAKACGVDSSGLSNCNVTAPSPGSSVPPPPAVPGNDGGISSGRIAWTGILSLLLLCVSITLY